MSSTNPFRINLDSIDDDQSIEPDVQPKDQPLTIGAIEPIIQEDLNTGQEGWFARAWSGFQERRQNRKSEQQRLDDIRSTPEDRERFAEINRRLSQDPTWQAIWSHKEDPSHIPEQEYMFAAMNIANEEARRRGNDEAERVMDEHVTVDPDAEPEHPITKEDPWGTVIWDTATRVPALFKRQFGGARMFMNAPRDLSYILEQAASEKVPPEDSLALEVESYLEGKSPETYYEELLQKAATDEGFNEGQAAFTEATNFLRDFEPRTGKSKAKYYSAAIIEGAIQMSPALIASAVTRSPTAGAALMGGQVFADQYAESIAQGRSHSEAVTDGIVFSAAETISERIPLGILTKEGGSFLKRILKSAGSEGIQEPLTELIQTGYTMSVIDEEMSFGEAMVAMFREPDLRQQLIDAGIIGAGVGASLATLTHPLYKGVTEDEIRNPPVRPRNKPTVLPSEAKKQISDEDARKLGLQEVEVTGDLLARVGSGEPLTTDEEYTLTNGGYGEFMGAEGNERVVLNKKGMAKLRELAEEPETESDEAQGFEHIVMEGDSITIEKDPHYSQDINTDALEDDVSPGETFRVETHESRQSARNRLLRAARRADPNPTEAQKEAGNYRKGHVRIQGMPIAIENPKGSTRRGNSTHELIERPSSYKNKKFGVRKIGDQSATWFDTRSQAEANLRRVDGGWSTKLKDNYGYLKGVEGKDKDHLDVFVGEHTKSDFIVVINQKKDPKKPLTEENFDEHKIMLGYRNEKEAINAYRRNYPDGPSLIGSAHPVSMDELKHWTETGNTKKIFDRSIDGFVAATKRKYPELKDFNLSARRNHENSLVLDDLLVDRDARKKGVGTKVMNDLIKFADQTGKLIELSVADRDSSTGTTSRSRLEKFYRRFGFVTNRGRNKRFELSMYTNMYREPKGRDPILKSEPRFSQKPRTNSGRGMKVSDLQDAIRPFYRSFRTAPAVKVVESIEDLPDHIQTQLRSINAETETNGVYSQDALTDTIYLIANNTTDSTEAIETLVHEVIGHYGLHQTIPIDIYNEVMDKVYESFKKEVTEAARIQELDITDRTERRVAAEEFIAYMAQRMVRKETVPQKIRALIRQIVQALRNRFRSMVGKDTLFTDAQIWSMIAQSQDYVRNPGGYKRDKIRGLRRHMGNPTYYSQMFKAINDAQAKSMSGQQWRQWIDTEVKKGRLKEEEVKWSGIREFLDNDLTWKDVSAMTTTVEFLPVEMQKLSEEMNLASARAHETSMAYRNRDIDLDLDSSHTPEQRAEYKRLLKESDDAEAEVVRLGKEWGKFVDQPAKKVPKEVLLRYIQLNGVDIEITNAGGSGGSFIEFDSSVRPDEEEEIKSDDAFYEVYNDWKYGDGNFEAYMEEALNEVYEENKYDPNLDDEENEANGWDGTSEEDMRDTAQERADESFDEDHYADQRNEWNKSAVRKSWYLGDYIVNTDEDGDFVVYNSETGADLGYSSDDDGVNRIISEDMEENGGGRWSEYTLEGGENYEEYLFRWKNPDKELFSIDSHWGRETNMVAHVRFDERKDIDGNTAIFIDEIQSDWHQHLRDHGTKDAIAADEHKQKAEDLWNKYLNEIQPDLATEMRGWELTPDILTKDLDISTEMTADVIDILRLFKLRFDRRERRIDEERENLARETLKALRAQFDKDVNRGYADPDSWDFNEKKAEARKIAADAPESQFVIDEYQNENWEDFINGLERTDIEHDQRGNLLLATTRPEIGIVYQALAPSVFKNEKPNFQRTKLEIDEAVKKTSDMRKLYLDFNEERNKWKQSVEGIEPAPFEKTWQLLVIKGMIKEAVSRGHKRLFIAPGEIHGMRWGGATTVDGVEFHLGKDSDGNHEVDLIPFSNMGDGGINPDKGAMRQSIPINKLHTIVGTDVAKEITQKIKQDIVKGQISAKDVGRETIAFAREKTDTMTGAREIYNVITPNLVNGKFLKKYKSQMKPGGKVFDYSGSSREADLEEHGLKGGEIISMPEDELLPYTVKELGKPEIDRFVTHTSAQHHPRWWGVFDLDGNLINNSVSYSQGDAYRWINVRKKSDDRGYFEAWEIEITPELKAAAQEGFAMFSRKTVKKPNDAFKKWFGDSKVVDESGDPLVVYHGTKSDFDTFKPKYGDGLLFFTINSKFAADWIKGIGGLRNPPEEAVPFIDKARKRERDLFNERVGDRNVSDLKTEDFEEIRNFVKDVMKGETGFERVSQMEDVIGSRVMPVYLSVQKPFDPRKDHKKIEKFLISVVGRKVVDEGYHKAGNWIVYERSDVISELKRLGYDGIHLAENIGGEHETIAVFDPSQVKSATGNQGTYDPNEPSILLSRRRRTGDPGLDGALDWANDNIGPQKPRTIEEWERRLNQVIRIENKAAKLEQALIDQFAGIKWAIRNTHGRDLDAAESGYKQAHFTTSGDSQMYAFMLHGAPEWRDGVTQIRNGTRGLLEVFEPAANNITEWGYWMAALRARQLMREGREHLFTADKIDELIKLGGDPETGAPGIFPEFDQVRKDYNDWKKMFLDWAEEAGVFDKDTRALWDQGEYVPFYRVKSDDLGGSFSQAAGMGVAGIANQRNPIKRLKGGKDPIGDIFENILINFTHMASTVMKNRAMTLTVQNLDGSGLMTPVPGKDFMEQRTIAESDLKKKLKAAGVDPASMPQAAFKAMQKMWTINAPKGENVVSVLVNGKKKYYHVHEETLLRSLTAINEVKFNSLLGRFGMWAPRKAKRLLTTMITLEPGFMVANWFRDVAMAFTNSRHAKFPRPDTGITGAFKALTHSEEMVSMMAAGGAFYSGYINAMDPTATAKSIKRAVRKSGVRDRILDSPWKVFELYNDLGAASENANRIGSAYIPAKKAGASTAEAVWEAKDLMNFAKHGDHAAMQFLIQTVPFLNARIQGLVRYGQRFKEAPGITITKSMMYMMAVLTIYLSNKDDERYKELPEEEKDLYVHLWLNGKHWRLPKAFEVGMLFGTAPERILEWAYSNEDDRGKLAIDRMKFVLDEVFMVMDPVTIVPMPQLIKPLVEASSNYSFFFRGPIVPEYMQDIAAVKPDQVYRPSTSPFARELATRMPRFLPDTLRNPMQLEFLMRGYLGTLGSYAMMTSDDLVRKHFDYPPRPALRWQQIPVAGRFYRGEEPASRTRYEQIMYEVRNNARQIARAVTQMQDRELDDEVDRFLEEPSKYNRVFTNQDIIDSSDAMDSSYQAIRRMRAEVNEIWEDTEMSPQEKLRQLNDVYVRRNEEARNAYSMRPGTEGAEQVGQLPVGTLALERAIAGMTPGEAIAFVRDNGLEATAELLDSLPVQASERARRVLGDAF